MNLLRFFVGSTLLAISGIVAFAPNLIWRAVTFSPSSQIVLGIIGISLGPLGFFLLYYANFMAEFKRTSLWLDKLSPVTFSLIIITLTVGFRLLVLYAFGATLQSDSLSYHNLAVELARTGSYGIDGTPTAYWPPGWPFVLSLVYRLFGENPLNGAALNIVLATITVLFVYGLVNRLFDRATARLTALLLAVLPGQILYEHLLYSEFLFVALLYGGLYLAQKESINRIGLGGLLLGLSALVRSTGIVAPLAQAATWAFQRMGTRRALLYTGVLIIGTILSLSAWSMRNAQSLGEVILFTSNGINLYIGQNPDSGVGYAEPDRHILPLDDPTREIYCDSLATALALEYMADHPGKVFVRGLGKVGYALVFELDPLLPQLRDRANLGRVDIQTLAVAAQSSWLIVLVMAGAGLVHLGVRRYFANRPQSLLLCFLFLGIMASIFLTYGSGRYRFAAVPILAAWAAVAVTGYREKQAGLSDLAEMPAKLSLDK